MWMGTSGLALTGAPHPALSPGGRGRGPSSSQPSPRRSERLGSKCDPSPPEWREMRGGSFGGSWGDSLVTAPSPYPLPRGAREQGTLPIRGETTSGEPVEVAAAGLAGEKRRLRAQLLEPLGRDGHAAAAAQVGLDHLGEGETAARLQELVVVGEHVGGELLGELGALRAYEREVGLDAAELLLERGFLLLALALARLEAALRLADVCGEALLGLHENEDLLLHPRLLLLDLLDLGEDGGVLLVGLDLVEPALRLGALGLNDLEVFFAAALLLLGRVQSGAGRLHVLLGCLDGGVDGGDLLGQAGGLGLVGGDARVHALEVDERLELGVHYADLAVDCDPSFNSALASPLEASASARKAPSPLRGEGEEVVGALGLEPRPDRL